MTIMATPRAGGVHKGAGKMPKLLPTVIIKYGVFYITAGQARPKSSFAAFQVIGPSPKELTFKMVRDTRFSHDKSPYNPAFRAHISSMGKLPIPVGYYLMIKPGGQSFLGGGLFADMFKDATRMVRDYISAHGAEWETIITAPSFQEHFTVGGTALKNVPAGYEKEHPQAKYLKFKSWYLEYPFQDEVFADSRQFLSTATDIFRRMKPFNDYLNKALAGFQMPAR